jgi:type I restriction enzyme S subunit
MAPEGWRTTKLGNIFKSRRERGRTGLPTLSVTLNDGLVLRESLERKMDTNLSPEEHLLVREGDIAYNMMRMWQGASGLSQFDALVSPAYVVLKPTNDIDPVFASYLFKSARMIYRFWAYSYGLTSDRLRLYYADFSIIPATLPPVEEQRRIAEILDAWDRAITTMDNLIANSERQKKALEQRVLVPTFHKPLSKHRLRDYCAFKGGSAFEEQHQGQSRGEHPFIKVSDMTLPENKLYIRNSNNWIDEGTRKRMKARLMPAGAIVFAKVGAALLLNRRRILERDTIIDNNMMAAIPKPPVNREFLYHFLNCLDFARFVQEGALPSVNQAELSAIKITFPDPRTQKEVARILTCADLETEAFERQRAALLREKAGLMQQLLSGKRRLTVADTSPSLVGNQVSL